MPPPGTPAPATPAAPGAPGAPAASGDPGPTGPGWVIELYGYHYFNEQGGQPGPAHVRSTIMAALEEGSVDLPTQSFERDADAADRQTFTMKELGISYPILATEQWERNHKIPNPNYEPPRNADFSGLRGEHGPGPGVPMGPAEAPKPEKIEPEFYTVTKYNFSVQFVWKEQRLGERLKAKEDAKKAAEAAAQGAPALPGPAPGPGTANTNPLPVTPTGAAS